uniref:Uncharacterized protein n=1 Tax=Romanomermis culicivorax TaxID=13658 RepID=A0A915KNV2_ROMCU
SIFTLRSESLAQILRKTTDCGLQLNRTERKFPFSSVDCIPFRSAEKKAKYNKINNNLKSNNPDFVQA